MQIAWAGAQPWSQNAPSDELEPTIIVGYDQGGNDYMPQDAAVQASEAAYAQGGLQRSGSKRVRTNDYIPSSMMTNANIPSTAPAEQTASYDQSNLYHPVVLRRLPRDATGFTTASCFPDRLQDNYNSEQAWPGPPAITQAPPSSYDDPAILSGVTDYTPATGAYVPQPSNVPTYLETNQSFAPAMAGQPPYAISTDYASIQTPMALSHAGDGYQRGVDWSSFAVTGSNMGMFQDAAELYGKDASQHLKLQSLTILDSLATQVIQTLAKTPLADLEKIAQGIDCDDRQSYLIQKDLFDQTLRVYGRETAFVNAFSAQLFLPSQQEVIRKANMATFIASMLGSHDVSLHDLNEHFLEIFVPMGHRMLKWQCTIFLELKTQTYISAVLNGEPNTALLLDELFPATMNRLIIARHPDAAHLVPTEHDFVERLKARKQYLQEEPQATAAQILPSKYSWPDFVKEFATCVQKNVGTLVGNPAQPAASAPVNGQGEAPRRPTSSTDRSSNTSDGTPTGTDDQTECMSYSNFGALVPNNHEMASLMYPNHAKFQKAAPSTASVPEKSPSPEAAKPTNTTTRQPWRTEEEDALLLGLEEVKGPYWSRILSLYGRGGSKSEILKDRSQIQLKDKARNLKLMHLKMGNEVPECLKGVTGELRKRGGAKLRAQLDQEGEAANTSAGAEKAD